MRGLRSNTSVHFKAPSVRSKALRGHEEYYPTATLIFYNREAVKCIPIMSI
jgi:hypothetical protein